MTDSGAANMTAGSQYLETEVERQDLGQVAESAPVEVPVEGVPRGGGVELEAELGALGKLPGTWVGNGFNLIARPDKQGHQPFFLELDATKETLEFTPISAPIPNRGSEQDDISFLGLTYLQRVNDAFTSGALHIEPGIWLSVPATTAPQAEASIVRMATGSARHLGAGPGPRLHRPGRTADRAGGLHPDQGGRQTDHPPRLPRAFRKTHAAAGDSTRRGREPQPRTHRGDQRPEHHRNGGPGHLDPAERWDREHPLPASRTPTRSR